MFGMKNNKEVKISFWANHLTTIVSVTLVLLLMGLIAMIWISADVETRRLKERIELSVIMRDSLPAGTTKMLADELSKQSYARNVKVVSKEEALQNWMDDTGEDLMELYGVNPLSEEITFSVSADYASAENLKKIENQLEKRTGVEAVSSPDAEMVDGMNRNISRLTLLLGIVAGIMLVISFVLINNTVHLSIYGRRFTIHTMQLVGATNGFIRRPVVIDNMLAGMVAGIISAALIAGAIFGAGESGVINATQYVSWAEYGIVSCGLVVAGMLLCGLASGVSASIYLHKDYDQLFK